MVLAYHLIISAYGFWLPNDERGSWSDFIRAYELYLAGGAANTTSDRRSLARRPYDRGRRDAARAALKYPAVVFEGVQARAVAGGFAKAADEYRYTIHACAVLPDHAHFVVARHARTIEQVRDHLKSRATRELNLRGVNPMAAYPEKPSPWARKGWHVFLDRVADIDRAVRYVEDNPARAGLRPQRWRFVVPFVA